MGEDMMGSFIITAILVGVAYAIASMLNHKYYFYRRDRFAVLWFTFVILTNLTLHLPYVVASLLSGPIESSHNIFLLTPNDYGKSDTRWLNNDPTILASELALVIVETILSYYVIRGVVLFTPYRHFCQITACTCQLYRFWFVYGVEIVTGFPHVNWSNPIYVLLHLVLGNIITVLIPTLILYEAYLDLSTGIMRLITPYRRGRSPRSSSRSFGHVRNRDSWFWHS